MNKERLQAIIDRIEADANNWDATRNILAFDIATFAQIDSGCKFDMFAARRDARIWLDLSSKQADYLLCSPLTLAEVRKFIENYNYDSNGYDSEGYDRFGYNREGYDRFDYDRFSYDREGYDRYGYDRDGYDQEGYDRVGFNRDGYDFDGLDKHNKPKVELTA